MKKITPVEVFCLENPVPRDTTTAALVNQADSHFITNGTVPFSTFKNEKGEMELGNVSLREVPSDSPNFVLFYVYFCEDDFVATAAYSKIDGSITFRSHWELWDGDLQDILAAVEKRCGAGTDKTNEPPKTPQDE